MESKIPKGWRTPLEFRNHRNKNDTRDLKSLFPIPLKTQLQHYLLGLLVTDGNLSVSRSRNRQGIGLSMTDKECVEAYRDYVCNRTTPLKIIVIPGRQRLIMGRMCSCKESYRVHVCCYKDLFYWKQHSLFPKKTGHEFYPKTVTQHGAFIRGVVDGDGGFCIRRTTCNFAICSMSRLFLLQTQRQINKIWTIKGSVHHSGTMWKLGYSLTYTTALQLRQFLYWDYDKRIVATESSVERPWTLRKRKILEYFIALGPQNHSTSSKFGDQKGENHPRATYTHEQVRKIKQMRNEFMMTAKQIQREMGGKQTNIEQILSGRHYKDVV